MEKSKEQLLIDMENDAYAAVRKYWLDDDYYRVLQLNEDKVGISKLFVFMKIQDTLNDIKCILHDMHETFKEATDEEC